MAVASWKERGLITFTFGFDTNLGQLSYMILRENSFCCISAK